MADVARAHGGDAGGDPPRGPYRIPAPCEAAPKKRGRGKATYKKLKDAYDKNGKKPLPIEFDMRDLRTFQPVGDNHSNFTRFIGTWIDLNVPLYYDRWDLVPEQYRVGLWSELQRYFDFAPFQAGPIWETVIAGIKRLCHERYKSRKAKRKDHLMKVGGYADIESARNKPPTNVDQEEWKKCIDYFIDPKQRKRSEINSRNRSRIQYPSLHGSRSYAAARHAKKMMSETQEYPSLLDTWRDMHTKASGEFVHPAAREDYDKLIAEQASLTQGAGSSSSVNEIGLQAMSKVLGERRGHNPGRGRKLKRVASSSSYEQVRSVVEKEYGEKLEAFMAETNMKMQQAMQQAMNAMRDPNAPIPDFAMFNMPQQPPNTNGDDNDDADLSVD